MKMQSHERLLSSVLLYTNYLEARLLLKRSLLSQVRDLRLLHASLG